MADEEVQQRRPYLPSPPPEGRDDSVGGSDDSDAPEQAEPAPPAPPPPAPAPEPEPEPEPEPAAEPEEQEEHHHHHQHHHERPVLPPELLHQPVVWFRPPEEFRRDRRRRRRKQLTWPCLDPMRTKFATPTLVALLPVMQHLYMHVMPLHLDLVPRNWVYRAFYICFMLTYRACMLVIDCPFGIRQTIRFFDVRLCVWLRTKFQRNAIFWVNVGHYQRDERNVHRCGLTMWARERMNFIEEAPLAVIVHMLVYFAVKMTEASVGLLTLPLLYSALLVKAAATNLNDDRELSEVHPTHVPLLCARHVAAFFFRRPFNFLDYWLYDPFIVLPAEFVEEFLDFLRFITSTPGPRPPMSPRQLLRHLAHRPVLQYIVRLVLEARADLGLDHYYERVEHPEDAAPAADGVQPQPEEAAPPPQQQEEAGGAAPAPAAAAAAQPAQAAQPRQPGGDDPRRPAAAPPAPPAAPAAAPVAARPAARARPQQRDGALAAPELGLNSLSLGRSNSDLADFHLAMAQNPDSPTVRELVFHFESPVLPSRPWAARGARQS